jgi:hypothetical protein
MSKVTKKEFFDHMSSIYGEKYNDVKAYKVLLEIIDRSDDDKFLAEIYEITTMNEKQRLIYRNELACLGKEYTPTQIDQYITLIEYALERLE